eukprot:TRINITY_DN4514_c0_g1_i1.p1 TRINITY_DN4514_c0_g1~~TRINITY_DN4514_c0_g1_i1.p1  ORF type:complete len:700 (-),score=154.86 TRINITY_DN4514_c0_g1_i1:256-2355(-)
MASPDGHPGVGASKKRLTSKMRALPPAVRMLQMLPRLALASDDQLEHLAKLFPKGGKEAMQAMCNLMQSGVVDCITWQTDSSKPEAICCATGRDGDRLDLLEPIPMPPTAGCTLQDTEHCLMSMVAQLRDSLRRVTREAIDSKDSIIELADKYPLQVCALVQRICFTKNIPSARRSGAGLKGAVSELKALRSEIREKLIDAELEDGPRMTLSMLTMLLQEQIMVASDLIERKDAEAQDQAWRDQVLFVYDRNEDRVEVRLFGETIPVGDEYVSGATLVTTSFTHFLRQAFINTMFAGSRVLILCGPAGSGKEPLLRDVGRLLGMLPCSVRCFEDTPTDEAFWDRTMEASRDMSGGRLAPFIVSQADRLPDETIKMILGIASTYEIALCMTFTPGPRADALKSGVLKNSTFLQMQEPNMEVIAEGLLAAEGARESEGLAPLLAQLLKTLKEQCAAQVHYELGPRTLAQLCTQIGSELRARKGVDEKQTAGAVARRCLLPSLVQGDAQVLKTLLSDLFGYSMSVPDPAATPSKRFARVVEYIMDITKVQPDCMVLPVPPDDEEAFFAEFCKGLNSEGASMVRVPGKLSDFSKEELLGTMPKKGEPVKDGLLVTTLREAMDQPNDTERHVWVVMMTGDISAKKWECLFELLNDSGCIKLATGEQLRLCEWLRFLFVMPGHGDTPTDTFSRSAVVYANPAAAS